MTASETGAAHIKKGRLAEQITARLHRMPGVSVERNVHLPSTGNPKIRREIDVLLASTVAGYPVHVAIECKNEKGPIGAPKIDAFYGKLQLVGIPAQHGIFVSASGYTEDALAAARQYGIRPLVLTGLTKEGLSKAVAEAFQEMIYLLAEVANIEITSNVATPSKPHELLMFYDEEGQICGTVLDLIWQAWVDGQPPSILGTYPLDLNVPGEWHQVIDGKHEDILSAKADVRVTALVVAFPGHASEHALVHATEGTIEKSELRVEFEATEGVFPVTTVRTEEELLALPAANPEKVQVTVGRIRLPRILYQGMYWPPSERVAQEVVGLMQAFEAGLIPDPRPLRLGDVEGTDMRALWEPIWKAHISAYPTSVPYQKGQGRSSDSPDTGVG